MPSNEAVIRRRRPARGVTVAIKATDFGPPIDSRQAIRMRYEMTKQLAALARQVADGGEAPLIPIDPSKVKWSKAELRRLRPSRFRAMVERQSRLEPAAAA